MSNISNRHNVNLFVAGKSQPLTGQRLAKIGYKSTKKTPAKFKSICVSVSQIELTKEHWEAHNDLFASIIKDALCNAQDGIIRTLYESSQGNLTSVSDDELSVNSCVAFIAAERDGGRLTKEFLSGWFNENMRDNLTIAIAEKLGTEDMEDKRIAAAVKAYHDMIASLSGGKTFYTPEQCKSLLRAIELSSVDDDTSAKLSARLEKMMNPQEKIEDLLEL
jgi:hypothetical protein